MTVDIFTPESFSQAKPAPLDESMVADPKTRTAFNKLQKKLRRGVGQAIADYNMIEDGYKIMVCLSVVKTVIPCLIFCLIYK